MSILFLDIDGVMNTNNAFLDRQGRNGGVHSWPWHYSNGPVPSDYDPGFTRSAVNVLNRIVARTGAKVVISSSWRDDASAETFNDWLELPRGTVIGKTPSSLFGGRGEEILAWLKVYGQDESWVAIDDCYISFDESITDPNHLELTDGNVGLTNANEVSILQKLKHFEPTQVSAKEMTLTYFAASEDSSIDTQAGNAPFAIESPRFVSHD